MFKNLGLIVVTVLLYLNPALGRQNEFVSYNRYRIYDVSGSEPSLSALRKSGFSTLQHRRRVDPSGELSGVVSYLVPPDQEPDFLRALDSLGAVDYNMTVSDLGKNIREERNDLRRMSSSVPFTETYHSYDEIVNYLFELSGIKSKKTLEPLVVLENIGKTFEKRDTYLVKISTNHSARKPIIFIDSGVHAREWLAPATAVYMIDQLVRNETYHQNILDVIDFYIIPLSNPDGYEYSRNYDRMWRKTRSVQGASRGVDVNRNFNFHWNGRGASDFPWSEIFRGPKPFSEVETRNIRDVGKKYAPRINTYIALHAYGPYILYPWSYALTAPAPKYELLDLIAKDAARAIYDFSNTEYQVGCSARLLYDSPGSSDDYFKGVLGVDLAFTLEVSSADEYSFVVPPPKIIGVASEAFEGIKVMAKYAASYQRN